MRTGAIGRLVVASVVRVAGIVKHREAATVTVFFAKTLLARA
jgi:hypothetical protein